MLWRSQIVCSLPVERMEEKIRQEGALEVIFFEGRKVKFI